MIRHISVLTFHDTPEKEANIAETRAFLETFPELCPTIRGYSVASPALETPKLPPEAQVMFGDLIQIADFETREDAAAYPATDAHIRLAQMTAESVRKVMTIDYEV